MLLSCFLVSCLVVVASSLRPERCPKLSWPLEEGACDEPQCKSNDDCQPEAICCSNGCVRTCYSKDTVLAFDWSEEPAENEIKIKEKKQFDLFEEGTVAFPGGCILNMEEYLRFEDFKNNEYIEDCFCKMGNILCRVAQR